MCAGTFRVQKFSESVTIGVAKPRLQENSFDRVHRTFPLIRSIVTPKRLLSQFFKHRSSLRLIGVCGFSVLTIAAIAAAQVTVVPNVPAYPFQVLPGATRQINVNVTGGTLNTIHWSVLSATGGASATFTTPAASGVATVAAGLPTVQVNIGSTAGNCSINGAMGSYSVTSPATVTIQAQSVDDTTKSGTFVFNVCAPSTTVLVAPAYQQAFKGQHRMLQSWVSGDADETGTWSITGQPGGGDGVLADTTNRDTDFVATVTGRYTLTYTSHSNSAKSGTAIVYVSPNAMPTYVSTPNKTEPRECYVDPALTGGDYEVGAGKAYASIQSTPASGTLAPGSIIRVWNTDTTGASPSTYNEYYQIASSGTATQPILLCGVADSHGNLPVVSGTNATTQAGTSTSAAAGLGIITTWPAGGHYGNYQDGSAGPSYVSITGLHIANGNQFNNYTPPGGGTPVAWGVLQGGGQSYFSSCINLRSGSYIDMGGNDLDTCALGIYSAENASNGWATITQLVTATGNHIHGSGNAGRETEHQVYFETWYGLMQGNLIDQYTPGAAGSSVKWRGVEGIFRYNNIASGAARLFDLVDAEDAIPYLDFDEYLGLPGDTNCDDSGWCLGDQLGANGLAAFEESWQKDFVYGNELFGTSTEQQNHYLADGGSGLQDRNGTLYYYSNTLDNAQFIFDIGSNGDGLNGYFPQRIDARNNIFWAATKSYTGNIQMEFATYSTVILSATTNLMLDGTFSIQTPIEGANPSDGTTEGWSSECDGTCLWPLSVPLNTHLYGLSDANYLTTATQPYNSTTMVPAAGSAAIEAGTALNGVLATMPVRWQYSIQSNSLIPRRDPLTIGAVDYAAVAATPTFSPTAGDYGTAQSVTISDTTPGATIYYAIKGTPTTSSTVFSTLTPIAVSATETINAIAVAPGYLQSQVGSASYGIGPLAATPTFSPAGGTYSAVEMVSITTATTTGSPVIYYTKDGTNPATSSTAVKYTGKISVAASETLNAVAEATGFSNSAEGTAAYTINLPVAATPIFSVPAGPYTSVQTVKITTATTAGSPVIYYTTDGSDPATSATAIKYTAPVVVNVSETLNAVVEATGYENSAIGSATYTINLPFAGPTYVQACNLEANYATSVTCTLNGVGAGHTLVIGVVGSGIVQSATVTSSSGTPTLAVKDGETLSAYILPNTPAGTVSITATVSAYQTYWLSVFEYANTAVSPLDGTAFTVATTWTPTAVSTPNLTTTSANDTLWSYCLAPGGYLFTPGSAPIPWTSLPTQTSGYENFVEDGPTTAAGTYYGQCDTGSGIAVPEIITLALKPPPGVSLSAKSLAFGSETVGAASASQYVVLTNSGESALSITSIAVTGADASSFVFGSNCGSSLAAGAECTIHGHFAPTAVGALTAAVTITDNVAGSPQSIALSGTGLVPPVTLSATSLSFGSANLGSMSGSQYVTLTNTGAVALTISSIAVTGTDASSFVFASNCGASLAVGAECTIHGHFAPTVSGALTAAVTITDNAAGSPQSIALSGAGLVPPVTLAATSLGFGSVTVDEISGSQYVTLTNTGTAALSITSIGVTGANASSFVFANTCGANLPAGANCSIHGHFAPMATGVQTAAVTITDSASGSPQSIALSGTGVTPVAPVTLSATNLSFGTEAVGTSGASQYVTMTNTGSVALQITSIAVTGADAGSFVFANSCGLSLAVGAECTIHGHFAPLTTGVLTAVVTITDSAAGSPQTISLTGTGQ